MASVKELQSLSRSIVRLQEGVRVHDKDLGTKGNGFKAQCNGAHSNHLEWMVLVLLGFVG